MVSHGNGRIRSGGEGVMALNKEQVLAALEGVASPTGTPLPRTGALSDVVAGDGKVFFSITVDAADWPWWRGPQRDGVANPDQDPPTEWSRQFDALGLNPE